MAVFARFHVPHQRRETHFRNKDALSVVQMHHPFIICGGSMGIVTSPEVASPDMTSPEVASPETMSLEMTSPDMTSPKPEVMNRKPEMKGR